MSCQFQKWAVGGCGCNFSATFKVEGCGSLAISGATVSVYDHSGGTLLASGTTDGSGNVALSLSSAGTYWVTITGMSARFASFGQNTTISGSGTVILTLSAAAGYICYTPCPIPLPTTLHATFSSLVSPTTLTWNSGTGSWEGTWTNGIEEYTFDLFPGGSFKMTDDVSGTCSAFFVSVSTACPPSTSLSWHMPSGTCLFPGTLDSTVTE